MSPVAQAGGTYAGGVSRPASTVGSYGAWVDDLLTAIGAPITTANEQALALWAASEGVVSSNNPLAISANPNGASGCIAQCGSGSPIYSYKDMATGVANTASFLQGGYYTNVVNAFRSNAGLQAIWAAINQSPWCKGCQGGHYPNALYQGIGNPGAALAAASGGQSGASSAGGGASSGGTPHDQFCASAVTGGYDFRFGRVGGCCSNVYMVNLTGQHFITECQARAFVGGALVVVGAGITLVGMLVVAAFGLRQSWARAGLRKVQSARPSFAKTPDVSAPAADDDEAGELLAFQQGERAERRAEARRAGRQTARAQRERATTAQEEAFGEAV